MRPILTLLIASATLAALPSAASAKGIVAAEVCGADGCTAVDNRWFHATVSEGDPLTRPVEAAPFVTLQVTFLHHEATPETLTYLPSQGVIRPEGAPEWIRLYPNRRAQLDALVAPVEPRPAAQLRGAAVVRPAPAGDTAPWLPIAGTITAALVLLALLARYATSALKARPRASKSAN